MDTEDDADLKVQRSAAKSLTELRTLLPLLLDHRHNGTLRRRIKETDVKTIFAKLEPFQEDPQLLDTDLKNFLPPLVDAYLESLQSAQKPLAHGFLPLDHTICRLLALFCKIRGEKVVKGFLNNEPRYLEPILKQLESSHDRLLVDGAPAQEAISPWTERYILFSWLSHLMLAPFPLTSLSGFQRCAGVSFGLETYLPAELPGITLRVLIVCLEGLGSATKERAAAATLLVKLCLRPDMQHLGLLSAVVKWISSFLANVDSDASSIHRSLGMISLLSGLLNSATNKEIDIVLATVRSSSNDIISWSTLSFVQSSAVARKLVMKVYRSIAVHCLQSNFNVSGLDAQGLLEEIIQYLIENLGDGDTPVRFAASKALSMITMKLDQETAGEIVEAIKAELEVNIFTQGGKRNLNAVDALKWHGAILTLSQLLFRRAVRTTQLRDILDHLLHALAFEQRSTQGGSIGTNVRDAACFGIWSLSRRYSKDELTALGKMATAGPNGDEMVSVPQRLAVDLLVAACLDPSGNIRRGSSAALQELIGRHPDTVEEGIKLVQTVDYHAVGLRQRAMIEVATEASKLHTIYWEALFTHLLGWRGVRSLDEASRSSAAESVGQLCLLQPHTMFRMLDEVYTALNSLEPREIEERQGLLMALAYLVKRFSIEAPSTNEESNISSQLTKLWHLLDSGLHLGQTSFDSPELRPELTASAVCDFLEAMANASTGLHKYSKQQIPVARIVQILNFCLRRYEDSVLTAIPGAVRAVVALFSLIDPDQRDRTINQWLAILQQEASYNGLRCSGHTMALGAAFTALYACGAGNTSRLHEQLSTVITETTARENFEGFDGIQSLPWAILVTLCFRCTPAVAVEARTVALQALETLLAHWNTHIHEGRTLPSSPPSGMDQNFIDTLHVALNDYTITERGDVGSLVRSQALKAVHVGLRSQLLSNEREDSADIALVDADLLRLSLEKLDKIRKQASSVLQDHQVLRKRLQSEDGRWFSADNVSSCEFFEDALRLYFVSDVSEVCKRALCVGFVSSAGMGSESVMRESRTAILNVLSTASDSEVHSFVDELTNIFQESLSNEKVLMELLEVFAFLFDWGVMDRLYTTTFRWRTLLSLTQKSHFKSTNMQKLLLALDVYRGLARAPLTRRDTLVKLTSMLLHPFPKIRQAAATQLYILSNDPKLKPLNWRRPTQDLKEVAGKVKEHVIPSADT